MRLEKYSGPDLQVLFATARADIGADAVLLSVRRVAMNPVMFELVASDPATARDWRPAGESPAPPPAPVKEPWKRLGEGPYRLALVGPTGGGKTTVLAKLTQSLEALGGLRVGWINLDTFKVGAAEQVSGLARLSGARLQTVRDEADVPGALRALSDRDVILIDCPGRGPAEREDDDFTRRMLVRLGPHEVHLVLPTGISAAIARRWVTRAETFRATHVLPTKRDEDSTSDTVFVLAERLGLPLRWIGSGQRLEGDLCRAPVYETSPERLTEDAEATATPV